MKNFREKKTNGKKRKEKKAKGNKKEQDCSHLMTNKNEFHQ